MRKGRKTPICHASPPRIPVFQAVVEAAAGEAARRVVQVQVGEAVGQIVEAAVQVVQVVEKVGQAAEQLVQAGEQVGLVAEQAG